MAQDVKKTEVPPVSNEAENRAAEAAVRERALKAVLDHITAVDSDRDYLNNKWLVCDRLWRGEPISRFYPGDKTTHIPEPFKQERAVTPRIRMALFPGDDWFRPIPLRPKSAKSMTVKALLDEQFRHGRFSSRFGQFVSNCAKYGTAFAKAPWVTDRRTVRMNEAKEKLKYENGVAVDIEKAGMDTREFTINRDRTEFRNISIFDFRCDRRYESIYDAPGCSDEFSQTVEDALRKLRQKVYAGVTEADIKKLMETGATAAPNAAKEQQQQASGGALQKPKPADDIKTVDFWGLFDLDGKGERVECNITVLNRTLVVRVAKNNLWHGRRPYVQGKWIPVEGELYGIGVIEPIVHLCLDINDMQNTLNAAAALIANPMFKVGDDFNIMDEQIIAAPGRVFRGGDIAQFQPVHVPDMTQVARLDKSILRDEISETNGTPRLFMGQMESGQESATGFSGRLKEGNLRIKEVATAFKEEVLDPFMEMVAFNNQQFLAEERTVILTGDAGAYQEFKVTPDELAGVARIEIAMAPQIELLGLRGQMMTNFLTVVSANPMLASIPNLPELLKIIWTNEFGYREQDRVFPPRGDEYQHAQREENVMLARGLPVDVKEWDNHPAHIQEIMAYEQTRYYQTLSADRKALLLAHRLTHEMHLRRSQEQVPMGPPPGMPPGMPGQPGLPGAGPMPGMPPEAPTPGIAQGRALAMTARGNMQPGG